MKQRRASESGTRGKRRWVASAAAAASLAMVLTGAAAAFAAAGETECVPNEKDGSCLPIAAANQRVDLGSPSFSRSTTITNPLFPIGALESVLMLGQVDGQPFRTEVTLLPETRTIAWNGQQVETLVSQYVAYLDGQLHEVALDWYAQAEDGAVWYFGEDVFNYEDGVVADTHGTWIAGADHPAGMIMPAAPRVGDVYRPENIPGVVFEEVTVSRTGETVPGPLAPVSGAIVVTELHQDGTTEEKTFAPGYGEFWTGGGGDVEAVVLAAPIDALSAPPSADLAALAAGANALFAAAGGGEWETMPDILATAAGAWQTYRTGAVPAMLDIQMGEAFDAAAGAIDARDADAVQQAALDMALSTLDLQLRERSVAEIDLARFELRSRQLLLDAASGDAAAVRGDIATLEWIWERVGHTIAPASRGTLTAALTELRAAADAADLSRVAPATETLRGALPSS